ncbi:MAG TPA: hypothetical protein VGI58_08090 [Streptosporangiaceae bacterium]
MDAADPINDAAEEKVKVAGQIAGVGKTIGRGSSAVEVADRCSCSGLVYAACTIERSDQVARAIPGTIEVAGKVSGEVASECVVALKIAGHGMSAV